MLSGDAFTRKSVSISFVARNILNSSLKKHLVFNSYSNLHAMTLMKDHLPWLKSSTERKKWMRS